MVVEYGVELDGVWLPLAMLRRLATHGPWDRPFTEATTDQERVLVAHSLADQHNQNGLHRGAGLSGFLNAVPFEPTVPFPVIPKDLLTGVPPVADGLPLVEPDQPEEVLHGRRAGRDRSPEASQGVDGGTGDREQPPRRR